MLREELLDRIKAKRLPISESQFRRYITNGLLQVEKKSEGRGSGVNSVFHDSALESLREVIRFRDHKSVNEASELIYVLFAKGYPVDFKKLKENFVDQFKLILESLQYTASMSLDEAEAEWFFGELAEKSLPARKPGRPSSKSMKERERKFDIEYRNSQYFGTFVSSIITRQLITGEFIMQMMADQELGKQTDPETANQFAKWLSRDKWENLIKSFTEEDLEEIQQIFVLLAKYSSAWMSTQPEKVPVIGPRVELTVKALDGLRLVETPRVAKMIIFFMLVPEWRTRVLGILSDEIRFQLWVEMCQSIIQSLANSKEV